MAVDVCSNSILEIGFLLDGRYVRCVCVCVTIIMIIIIEDACCWCDKITNRATAAVALNAKLSAKLYMEPIATHTHSVVVFI